MRRAARRPFPGRPGSRPRRAVRCRAAQGERRIGQHPWRWPRQARPRQTARRHVSRPTAVLESRSHRPIPWQRELRKAPRSSRDGSNRRPGAQIKGRSLNRRRKHTARMAGPGRIGRRTFGPAAQGQRPAPRIVQRSDRHLHKDRPLSGEDKRSLQGELLDAVKPDAVRSQKGKLEKGRAGHDGRAEHHVASQPGVIGQRQPPREQKPIAVRQPDRGPQQWMVRRALAGRRDVGLFGSGGLKPAPYGAATTNACFMTLSGDATIVDRTRYEIALPGSTPLALLRLPHMRREADWPHIGPVLPYLMSNKRSLLHAHTGSTRLPYLPRYIFTSIGRQIITNAIFNLVLGCTQLYQ
jgi:hypothetical protein